MLKAPYLLKYFQKGDRILLYARGVNGRKIYSFLKEHPLFHVIGFVDQNADSMTDAEVPVYRPDRLKAIPADSYDKIVITVLHQKMGDEIYQIIKESGVAEDKIIAPYTYLGPACTLSVWNILQDPAWLQQELKAFIVRSTTNRAAYFEPLRQELESRGQEKDRLLPRFKEIARNLTPLENTVFLYILYLAGMFDAELMEHMLECLLKIEREEMRLLLHGMFIESSLMCFLHPEYLFPEFYNMRRALLKQVCGMYDFRMETGRRQKQKDGKTNKICILTHILYDQTSSPTLLALQLGGMLANLGYEVMLMPLDVCGYMALENPVFCPIGFEMYGDSREFEEYHKRVCHPKVAVEYTDEAELKKKMQLELNKIAAFSPDLILDMTDEFSILSYIYSQHFTTLYLPMRGYQSSSFFTYFAARDRNDFALESSIYHSVDENAVVEFPVCILPPEPQTVYKRHDFLLEDHDFVLVTVGGRLNTEMSSEFIDLICSKLLSKPNIKWIIIGSTNDYLSQTYADYISRKKVIYIPYEKDLPAFYKLCNLYINPKRMGGGASITWAMHNGLPVATLSNPNDVMPVIGVENAADNYTQMIDYVLALWSNPVSWKQNSEKFQKRALDFEASFPKIIQTNLSKIEKLKKLERLGEK